MKNNSIAEKSLKELEAYIETSQWKGYDPFDGLNSRIFQALPLKRSRYARIACVQFFKRFPINLRPVFLIRRDMNPKGSGLFLLGYLRLYQLTGEKKFQKLSLQFMDVLKDCAAKGWSGYCWGYNFDWQSRAFFVPKGTPTIVNTSFIANAFLDAYEILGNKAFFEVARSACDFILNDLHISRSRCGICFSYTPVDRSRIFNASLLGAQLLARVASSSNEDTLRAMAREAVRFVVAHQREDGAWYYGMEPNQQWIDSHHTGFILVALCDYLKFSGELGFEDVLRRGFEFYRRTMILNDGRIRFRLDRLFPIDIHAQAQGIITLLKLKAFDESAIERACEVAQWTIQHMQGSKGAFYFQKGRFGINRISYMRWNNAWMFYALSLLLTSLRASRENGEW